MKKTVNVLIVIVIAFTLMFTLGAWAMTTTTGMHLINSIIDSTPIGSTTPSTGKFTSLNANSGAFGYVVAGSTSATNPQGAYLGWNVTGGGGETDFVNSKGAGAGGWSFINVPTGGAIGSPVARIDGSGNVFAPSFNGNLNGNSTSATTANSANTANSAGSANVLNSPVFNCGPTTPATGIQTNGNANCGSYPNSLGNTGYTTLPGGLILQWVTGTYQSTSGFSQQLNFPKAFPHACLSVTASTVANSPTDTDMSFYQVVGWSLFSATVYMQRNADHAFTPAQPVVWAIGY